VKKSGLTGKYDNVRRYWEDEVTRLFLRPYLKELVDLKAKRLERLRVLDLGCGNGDGYDLITGITSRDVGIYEYSVEIINQESLGLYLGIDINPDLIREAEEYHAGNEKVAFKLADFSDSVFHDEATFDIYFTSYGTLSHNQDDQTVKLLCDIAQHCGDHALIICDWLGRYSYEWQDLWIKDPTEESFMDYRISYIYPPEDRNVVDIKSFPLRLVSMQEALNIINEAIEACGVNIQIKKFFDRSIFVGRHMDTGEYNRHCPPIRETVNALLEPNTRTDLSSLIIDYIPRKGFTDLNEFFEGFSMCWNSLVKHTMEFLEEYQEDDSVLFNSVDIHTFYPESLKTAVQTMRKVINATGNLPGDARANIIELQLAYALRRLEMDMQPGLGVGHGMISILEVTR
jgi:SAM-dependent methyltransferase